MTTGADAYAGAEMLGEPSAVLSGLERMLAEPDSPWWVELVSEDQTDKFAALLGDLKRKHSPTGDGKRITSGYSYMGLEPAIAWADACRDRLYPVMKQSIESFGQRWSRIRGSLGTAPHHYVSLGPGDGQKDAVILRDLRRDNGRLCYVPVDTSTEMLRLAVRDLIVHHKFSRKRILSLPLDFSASGNVVALRRLLTETFGETAVLFSLLGNTLANFDDDAELLQMLATQLLRPQDRFLLEVATTPGVNEGLATDAAFEYERSRSFGAFVTSALRRYTDLHVDMDSVQYLGTVESGHALIIKMIYRNQTRGNIHIKLPNGTNILFRQGDTIRLLLTRKYTQAGISLLLIAGGVTNVGSTHDEFPAPDSGHCFGMNLMILAKQQDTVPYQADAASKETLADDVWRR